MATTLRFRDHSEFHREVLHMTVGAMAATLAGYGLELLLPAWKGLALSVTSLLALGLLIGATPSGSRLAPAHLLRQAAIALAAGLAFVLLAGRWPAFGSAATGLILGVGLAPRATRTVAGAVVAAAAGTFCMAALVAGVVQGQLVASAGVPLLVARGVAGAAFGFLTAMAMLPRHLELHRDPLEEAFAGVRDSLRGEIRDLCERAIGLTRRIREALSERPEEECKQVMRTVEDLVRKMFHLAKRWQGVERDGGGTAPDELVARLQALDERIGRTEDPIAREQYQKAKAALAAQLGYLQEIGRSRERIVARMHNYLSGLERLRFAILNHRSTDAQKLGSEVQPIVEELEEMGRDVELSTQATDEAEQVAWEAERSAKGEGGEVETVKAGGAGSTGNKEASSESAAPAAAAN